MAVYTVQAGKSCLVLMISPQDTRDSLKNGITGKTELIRQKSPDPRIAAYGGKTVTDMSGWHRWRTDLPEPAALTVRAGWYFRVSMIWRGVIRI